MNRILTGRISNDEPIYIEEYKNMNGYKAIEKNSIENKDKLIEEIKISGLTGRGGAYFPTYLKIADVIKSSGEKYLICNADEGEPGNFKDKYLIEHDPHMIIEGMIILANIINAKKAYIYIREEYDKARQILNKALKEAKANNLITDNFDIEIFSGAGSYLCGEEFALIASIEGNKGAPRIKPPYPSTSGLFGKPTLLLNVETIANIPFIILNGGKSFSEAETKLISLSGNVNKKGVFEVSFKTSLRTIIEKYGETENNIKLIQLGGASGPVIPYNMIDSSIEELNNQGLSIGSGAVIVINYDYNIFDILKNIIVFFDNESCGKCTPCREGLKEIIEILEKFKNEEAEEKDLENLEVLVNIIRDTSFCGLGIFSVTSVISALKYFRAEFESSIFDRRFI